MYGDVQRSNVESKGSVKLLCFLIAELLGLDLAHLNAQSIAYSLCQGLVGRAREYFNVWHSVID